MGDVSRRVFCGMSARQPVADAPVARSIAERIVDDGMARTREVSAALLAIEDSVRRADTPGPRCARPWCPRRPARGRDVCVQCHHAESLKAKRQGETLALVAAGWTPTTAHGRHWRDPIAPHPVRTRKEALVIVRRETRGTGVRS